jgi:hypothetical protein
LALGTRAHHHVAGARIASEFGTVVVRSFSAPNIWFDEPFVQKYPGFVPEGRPQTKGLLSSSYEPRGEERNCKKYANLGRVGRVGGNLIETKASAKNSGQCVVVSGQSMQSPGLAVPGNKQPVQR